jgi:hypothetical protein
VSKYNRAKRIFTEFGYSGPETFQLQEYPGGSPVGDQTSFMVKFGSDVDSATQFSVVVLHQIYGLDNSTRLIFFVTAFHIRDYILKTNAVPKDIVNQFLQDVDLKDCRDLCDKGKHLRLTQRTDPSVAILEGTLGGAPLGAVVMGGDDVWMLFSGNREVDIKWLAERVLEKWERFFATNGL